MGIAGGRFKRAFFGMATGGADWPMIVADMPLRSEIEVGRCLKVAAKTVMLV